MEDKMKILVVFTGGTIGCELKDEFVSLESSTKQLLINNYISKKGENINFVSSSPYTILSENLSGENIETLCRFVNENTYSGYDGIIVAHGTDTLQYTAAALSYTLGRKDIPIVVVSANYPLDSEKSNGNINFEAAVEFIRTKADNGVFVSYKNSSDDFTTFHHGINLLSHGEGAEDIFSLNNNVYGFYKDGKIVRNEKYIPKLFTDFSSNYSLKSDADILVIKSQPGDCFKYDLSSYKAVLLMPYHSSTLNTENKYLHYFCKEAKKRNIPVFVIDYRTEYIYESTKLFDELGVIRLAFETLPAVYIKLWIAISINADIKSYYRYRPKGDNRQKYNRQV